MITISKRALVMVGLMALCAPLQAQKSKSKPASATQEIKVAMIADKWEFQADAAEFSNHKDVPAIKLVKGSKAVLKDLQFTDGTIEYDIEPLAEGFAGIYFHMADDKESEYFYLRVSRAGNLAAMDAAQYAPILNGVNLWDMMDHYQGPAIIKKGEWNHIKLLISGKQMVIYVNDMNRATLQVPKLEGNTPSGRLAFDGRCVIGNLVVRPGSVEGLGAAEGFDPSHRDPRYLRTWQVTTPQPLPKGRELFDGEFPKPSTTWQNIDAERLGLINLTRIYGASESRRFVWLRVRLTSAKEQKRTINLGFSDEVWVYLNRQPIYVDKNIYYSAGMRKYPDGRISVENSKFDMTLKEGDNELMVGVANDFFGWGIIAQLDNMDGIVANVNFPPPVMQPKDLSGYLGVYKSPDSPGKITIAEKEGKVMADAEGEGSFEMEYFEKDKFRLLVADVVFEFNPSEKKMMIKQGMGVTTYTKVE